MKLILSPPSLDDLLRLLKAWRFWVLAFLVGGLVGAAVYYIAPPPYRARASVLVDFNLEQAWPEETDRQLFYYLDRETRKLEELAWSDAVMQAVADETGLPVSILRDEKLLLSQPAEGGWRFHAVDRETRRAQTLASAWAEAFADTLRKGVEAGEVNSFVQVTVTQAENLPVARVVSMGEYALAGAFGLLFLGAFAVLFFDRSTK